MTIVVAQKAFNTLVNGTTFTVSLGGVSTANQLLLIVSSSEVPSAVPSGFTQIYAPTPGTSNTATKFYLKATPASGSATINFSLATYAGASLLEISGLAPSPLDITNFTNITGNTQASSVSTGTLSQANEIIIAALAYGLPGGVANSAITNPPVGFTTIAVDTNSNNDQALEHAYKIVSATTSVTASWTWSDTALTDSQSSIISLKGATGAVTPTQFKIYANGAMQANAFVQSALPAGVALRFYANNVVHSANLVLNGSGQFQMYANGTLSVNSTIIV
jgi:hypothetical protein